MNALELHDVRHRFEEASLRFDLTVAQGECLAVIGPSGAGKSTLLDLAAGFLPAGGGTVWMGGADVTTLEPARRPVTMVFQDNNLFPHLSAEDNVAIGIQPGLRIGARARSRAREALAAVGLGALARRRPAEMSGGERQRVAIARAVVRNRPLLLLDEPFAALGPALRREMLDLVATLRRDAPAPLAIVMVTHHPDDARGFADRIAFLEAGRIAATGTVSAILDGSVDPAIRSYLGAGVGA